MHDNCLGGLPTNKPELQGPLPECSRLVGNDSQQEGSAQERLAVFNPARRQGIMEGA